MPEPTKEKDMDRLRRLAGVLREALSNATDGSPTSSQSAPGVKKLRGPSARRMKNSIP
jgi:hypothetical protein